MKKAILLLLLATSVALAGPKRSVGNALGGKAMAGYKAPAGRAAVKLRVPAGGKKRVAATLSVPGDSTTKYLDDAHYGDVREMSLKLLRKYSPDKHYFIAVGRSPAAIAAFLTELNPNMVMTFPASDLRLGVQAEWKPDYFKHFADLIPEDVVRGGRTIVLFDRSHDQSGTSLAAVKKLLTEYLQKVNGKPIKVRAVGLAGKGPLVAGVEHLSTASNPHTFQYFSGTDHDEKFAPFKEKHRIGTEGMEEMKDNPQNEKLRDAMRDRMAHDAKLKQALKKGFAKFLE